MPWLSSWKAENHAIGEKCMENAGELQQTARDWRFVIARLLEAIIGVILLLAGVLKAWSPMDFGRQIAEYGIITQPTVVTALAWLMIIVECALGTALIVGYRRRIAVPAAIVLIIMFLGAVSWAWYTGATEDCGCFGSWAKRTPAEAFLEDLWMLALIAGAWMLSRREPVRFRGWRSGAVAVSILAAVAITAVAGGSDRQSADPLVRLGAGSPAKKQFAGLKVSGLDVDLERGTQIVMLMDTGCTHCQQSVPEVNRLAKAQDLGAGVLALCSNSGKEVDWFNGKFKPEFPLGRISYDDFMRLFERGKTPRMMLVRDAAVVKIWDGVVPSADEVRNSLSGR